MRLSGLIETLKHKLVASITKVIKDTEELDRIIEEMTEQALRRINMKLQEKMFVRTLDGILKVVEVRDDNVVGRFVNEDGNVYFMNEIIGSPNFDIGKLIEEGDILLLFDKEYEKKYKAEVVVDGENFKSVINYEQDTLLNLEYELITNEHIELLEILTKEQFEQMSYKVGE